MAEISLWPTFDTVKERHWGEGSPTAHTDHPKCAVVYGESSLIPSRPRISADLVQALKSLADIEADALSMDHAAPGQEVVKEAKRILRGMYEYLPRQYNVSSMSEGRIGIDAYGGFGRSMLLICEPGGTALCIVTIDQVSRRARYGDSGFLPDDFVKEGLRQLGNV